MQVSRLGSGWKRLSQRNESANRGQKMSLRQIAKELEISPAYLSYMLNGKRPWRKDLYQRYMGVVNTFVNSAHVGVNKKDDALVAVGMKIGAEDEI
jgi:DNA-directed RNA polymerase specialized sigma subunit